MRIGIIVFPGSNCDHDCRFVTRDLLGEPTLSIWHKETKLPPLDLVIIPGGFSYGDYLRPGAIARFSPVMDAVIDFAKQGGYVLGICNGFQILVEVGLLPGTLLRNHSMKFICKTISIRVENNQTPFTSQYQSGQVLSIPIAHAEGNYFIDPSSLKDLNKKKQILFRYVTKTGETSEGANPNGSVEHVAGLCNEAGNILGMMPHPERASDPLLGGDDGIGVFRSLQAAQAKDL
ncbi:MAG: phosphoribosylformylglycinamidine synthase subunit PurQ [Nitrospira sp.]|nr:phosphoribosylformylglycinamidine synthase subunit PurQ [Candidatus Manganitrophaceae bacterium]HIL34506.1 phosphoribosylformylglycinamidine synthase subunit PurQ [Candidatus Manganitrophaceae bacterium]